MNLAEMTCNCVRSGRLDCHLPLPLVPKLRNTNFKLNKNFRQIFYITTKLLITVILSLLLLAPS